MERPVHIVVPVLPEGQDDPDLLREIEETEQYLATAGFQFESGGVSIVFLRGSASSDSQTMLAALVFVNGGNRPMEGLRCLLSIELRNNPAVVLPVTIDLPARVTGRIAQGEGLLVHLGIPMRGLSEDCLFSASDVDCDVSGMQTEMIW